MAKNLVLFSDGTGNSAAKLCKTNVWRTYQAIDLAEPADPQLPRQFACYDDGVGSSSFKPYALLGGAFGVGLARNVLDLYVFLCRTYEPGDRIYAFGFSRGAFTIRVLVGLVMSQGLLRYHGSEGELERLARDAYRCYRGERFRSLNPAVGGLRRLRDAGIEVGNRILRRPSYAQADRIGRPDAPDAITIEFLGLWDTVDAYGLPVDELTRVIDTLIWPLTMRDYNLNERVRRACHALAVDDERNAFHPRLWNEQPDPRRAGVGVPGGNLATERIDQERISQVWFAGVHSNVGGGYPDDGLSYVPLQWIMDEARRHGLRFEREIEEQQRALRDENAPIYDSRRGLAAYYRYNPRRIEQLTNTDKVRVGRTKVHESVLRRIRAGHDGYAPIALPPGFAVVTADGRIVDGDEYLRRLPPRGSTSSSGPATPLVAATAPYADRREHVFNWVWRRRVNYFATLALSLVLAAMPWFAPGTGACSGELCSLAGPLRALGAVLPSFTDRWLDAFASTPALSLPLLLALAVAMARGSALQRRVRDEMRRVWYDLPALRPGSPVGLAAPMPPGALERAIERLRRHRAYQAGFRVFTRGVLPTGFVAAIAYGAVLAVNRWLGSSA